MEGEINDHPAMIFPVYPCLFGILPFNSKGLKNKTLPIRQYCRRNDNPADFISCCLYWLFLYWSLGGIDICCLS